MGHSSKKKKKGGGGSGRRIRGRGTVKEVSHADDSSEIITDEITALCAIFQEDCEVVSHSPPEVVVKISPYSKDSEYENSDVCCCLVVRCSHGYPFKCPKLQLTQARGLSEFAAENLLSLLHDQANSSAREGRVMIFNLVEIAQEYLTEIVPLDQPRESVPNSTTNGDKQFYGRDSTVFCKEDFYDGLFVYGFTDLFGDFGEAQWGVKMNDITVEGHALPPETYRAPTPNPVLETKPGSSRRPFLVTDTQLLPYASTTKKLDGLKEESENGSTTDSSILLTEKSPGSIVVANEDNPLIGRIFDIVDSDLDCEFQGSVSFDSIGSDNLTTQNLKRDLVMIHLLHIACASEGQGDDFSEISTELYNLGIFSEFAHDLATKSSSNFIKAFDRLFREHMISSKHIQFWKRISNFGKPTSTSLSSRYMDDFEELQPLGHGGFGHVLLCRNKLDGRQYAVKKIRLKHRTLSVNDRILREVATLSRLQHQHVVRYYQAWFETGFHSSIGDTTILASRTFNSSYGYNDGTSVDPIGNENKVESTFLYIQMEYCPRTLRQVFESYNHFDSELAWHLFRQIVEGLAHIHGQGIIHRDLTPNNIFFDARNDVKIGDFGLAKFLKLEQFEQDQTTEVETSGISVDGTGQVGTYFYTAPEIEQRWPKIDEKVDMYSLGIVFFELWHPFGTAMERHIVLSDLKNKGELPSQWAAEFPEQTLLLQRLISPRPSERPSAIEVLQNSFPPQLEFELVDNMLRTMQISEDTRIYDKVVNAIFDDEALRMKYHPEHTATLSLKGTFFGSVMEDDTDLRDNVIDITREVFGCHCAKHVDTVPMRLLDEFPQFERKSVKLLTSGGGIIELCHELRFPFVSWVVKNQKMSCKRYDVSFVYRKGVGHAPPNRYLQGDFDIIGGDSVLMEAEAIKVSMDVLIRFFRADACDIHVNHAGLIHAIWSWVGIKVGLRRKVAELLSLMSSLRPESSKWKSKWVVVRRQLLQELRLGEAIVNRLQTVGLRFCGPVDQAVPRLRGALPRDKATWKALDELWDLFSFLRMWKLDKYTFLNAIMPPSENYHRDLFFQIYLVGENIPGPLTDGVLLGIGGRYDYLLNQMWCHDNKSTAPAGVGISLGLESVIQHSTEIRHRRCDADVHVLVCSRGGGGLLKERIELASELWKEGIKAEFVPVSDPSLREQYEYAYEHGIRCLIIVNDSSTSGTGLKVRHLELKKEREIERDNLVKFLLDAEATHFRNPSIWN